MGHEGFRGVWNPDEVLQEMPQRVVAHIDLDCFYCQVEQKRLNIPRDVPCAVQQWHSLIAVSYAARALGVTRGMTVAKAKLKCPGIRLVHVETIGGGGNRDSGDRETSTRRRATQKACLERYREASLQVMGILQREAPNALFEKASIDEVYMDLTKSVVSLLEESTHSGSEGIDKLRTVFSHVIGGSLDLSSDLDLRLAAGALITHKLREAVASEALYTCSAGIAHNKQLAKLVSGKHKPNQQTVVTLRSVASLLAATQVKDLRFFGGKLGTRLEEMGCKTAADVQHVAMTTLTHEFGEEKARWVARCVRGMEDGHVQPKCMPKSMMAAKTFEKTHDVCSVERWAGILAEELADRIKRDGSMYNRKPRNLLLHYKSSKSSINRSRCCPMPSYGQDGPDAHSLTKAAMSIFRGLDDALPCAQLAIGATDFMEAPVASKHSIARFLSGAKRKYPDVEHANGPTCSTVCANGDKDVIEGLCPENYPKPTPIHPRGSEGGCGQASTPSLKMTPVKSMKNRHTATLKEVWSKGLHKLEQDIDLDKIDIQEQTKLLEEISKMQDSSPERTRKPVSLSRMGYSKMKPSGEKRQLDISSMLKTIAKPSHK